MLYYLLYPLRDIFFGFNVFRYITFRAAFASVSAFLITVLFGPFVIKKLKKLKFGEEIRNSECPSLYPLHKDKQGTPTMGGLLILFGVTISTLLWADFKNSFVVVSLLVMLWLGLVGFLDDYKKLRVKTIRGLRARTKLISQILAGGIVGLFLYLRRDANTMLEFPFFKKLSMDLGAFYVPFVILVIVGTSNAVNITDGLDGLATGCVVMAAIAYTGMSYITGHVRFAEYLGVYYTPEAAELTVFCASIVGSGLGFLWFNAFPATVFMGDTGALALGGAIGSIAVFIKKELLLFLVGGIFVMEAASVVIQVFSYKTRHKRVFKVAPIHHHFQLNGWSEPKVTVRLWIVAIILALLSFATLKLR